MPSGISRALYFPRYEETQLGKIRHGCQLSLNSNGTVATRKMISLAAHRVMSGDFMCQTASAGPNSFYAVAYSTGGVNRLGTYRPNTHIVGEMVSAL